MYNKIPFIESFKDVTHIRCADCGKMIKITWNDEIDSICEDCYKKARENDHISWQPAQKDTGD